MGSGIAEETDGEVTDMVNTVTTGYGNTEEMEDFDEGEGSGVDTTISIKKMGDEKETDGEVTDMLNTEEMELDVDVKLEVNNNGNFTETDFDEGEGSGVDTRSDVGSGVETTEENIYSGSIKKMGDEKETDGEVTDMLNTEEMELDADFDEGEGSGVDTRSDVGSGVETTEENIYSGDTDDIAAEKIGENITNDTDAVSKIVTYISLVAGAVCILIFILACYRVIRYIRMSKV